MRTLEVAVTVVAAKEEILLVRNPEWQAFTLPMTKIRRKTLGLIANAGHVERWTDAAMRNVGEFLGRTADCEPKLLMDVASLEQNDHTGEMKHYHFQIHLVEMDCKVTAPGVAAEWLTAAQILEPHRRPISSTARKLTELLAAEAAGRQLKFPPIDHGVPRRQSQAVAAIIARQDTGIAKWLVQWNENWGRYHLLGGRRENAEAGTVCLARELREKLHLEPGEYESEPIGSAPLKYSDWSASAWRDTDYTVWPFRVTLTPAAIAKINNDTANRWLTRQQVLNERCDDDRVVSTRTRKTLEMVE